MNRRRLLTRGLLFVGLLLAGGLLYALPTLEWLILSIEWIRGAGALGVLAFLGVYLLWTLLMGPASWIQAAAGLLYGPIPGIALAWFASNASGLVAFRLARGTLRDWVARRLARFPLHGAIDRAVGRDGAGLVLLLRLSPLSPFNPICYAMGLTRVRASRYALGTAIGSLVPVSLYAFLGSTAGDVQRIASGEAASEAGWFTATALGLTAVATVCVSLVARRALRQALAEAPAPREDGSVAVQPAAG